MTPCPLKLFPSRPVLAALAFLLAPVLHAEGLRPNFLFSDNMILQRDREVPVWGDAKPGSPVTVTFNGKTASGTADSSGKWKVFLGPSPAGGPFEMKISSAGENVVIKNVLMGDVWFCSGQSNMQWSVLRSKDGAKEAPAATFPNIRLLTIPMRGASKPQSNLEGVAWSECSPETVKDFSAVAYYFGRNLYEHNHVPVGLINSSWGGSAVQTWTSLAGLETNPDAVGITREFHSVVKRFDKDFAAGVVDERDAYIDKGIQEKEKGWEAVEFDDTKWPEWALPGYFNMYGKPLYVQGAVWFRKTVEIPDTWAGKPLVLALGNINNYDITWFNGTEVGRTDKDALKDKNRARREYTIPGELVKPGKAVVAVRVFNSLSSGGILGYPDWQKRDIGLNLADNKKEIVSLKGPWKYGQGNPLPPRGTNADPESHKLPSSLFNGMVSPVIPFALRGIVFYQGESNTHNAWEYGTIFPRMIQSWREAWQEEIPFLFVQLPGLGKASESPAEDSKYNESWNELRDAQWRGLREPKTAMISAIDLGDESIHPANKQDVGVRLALAARALALGEKLEYSGPLYAGLTVEGNKIRVRFTHTGEGLVAKDNGELQRFAIAGADQKYVWANAKIDGDTVVVWSDQVPSPVAVSYAWDMAPAGANLSNKAGLPAASFRSEDWPVRTFGRKSPY